MDPKEEESRARYRYLQLKSRAVGSETTGQMRDAVAQPSGNTPPPNSNFEIQGRSQPAMGGTPSYAPPDSTTPGPDISPVRALLTNEPTSGHIESFMRGVPAQIGGAAGGVFGGGLTAGMAAVPAAFVGAAGGEGVRQNLAQAYSAVTNRPFSSPGQVAGNMGLQGALGAAGQMGAVALNNASKYVVRAAGERLPATLKNFFGIPEPMTQYVQGQGSKQVFTSPNLNAGADLANVGEATAGLAARRASVGKSIGDSEDFLLDLGQGSRPVDTTDIAGELHGTMMKKGYLDPRTADLARSKDVGLLNKTLDTLEGGGSRQTVAPTPATTSPLVDNLGRPMVTPANPGVSIPDGPLTLRQAINTKRLIDSQLDFGGQLNREISDPAAAIAKGVNAQLRDKVRTELGPMVSKLYDDFGVIADAQEKLAEFTGTKALSNVEQRAVQALRGIMLKNPGEVDNIVKVLGAGLPGGEQQARTIFDSIAAGAFTKEGIGAPSNIILKGAAAIGLTGGRVARAMVRGAENIVGADIHPAALSYGLGGATFSPLAAQYMRRKIDK